MLVGVIGEKISIVGKGKSSHSYVEGTSVPSDTSKFKMCGHMSYLLLYRGSNIGLVPM